MSQSHPSSWFEPLYAKAQGDTAQIPWARLQPNPKLLEWLSCSSRDASEARAIVVGCGLGDDAKAICDRGYQVTAFDISETAISWAQQRFSEETIDFQVADLFDLPPAWMHQFDLVFESITIQALPLEIRQAAMQQVRKLLAPQGVLLVSTYLRPDVTPPEGPPWPLTLAELDYFETLNLRKLNAQTYRQKDSVYPSRIFAQYLSVG